MSQNKYTKNIMEILCENTILSVMDKFIYEAALSIEIDDENAWFINFGSSAHMSCNKEWYDEYYENMDGIFIYLGDNRSHKFQCYGVLISVKFTDGQVKQIHNVMCALGIKKNLISISTIENIDLKVEFVKTRCVVKDS